jgi:hypothetical protein
MAHSPVKSRAGNSYLSDSAQFNSAPGHPEGYLEAFAIYIRISADIICKIRRRTNRTNA